MRRHTRTSVGYITCADRVGVERDLVVVDVGQPAEGGVVVERVRAVEAATGDDRPWGVVIAGRQGAARERGEGEAARVALQPVPLQGDGPDPLEAADGVRHRAGQGVPTHPQVVDVGEVADGIGYISDETIAAYIEHGQTREPVDAAWDRAAKTISKQHQLRQALQISDAGGDSAVELVVAKNK